MAQLQDDPKLGTNENTIESANIMASGDSQESIEEKMEIDESTTDLKDLEAVTCYCGKDRTLGSAELQCGFCLRFYHADCITCYMGNVVAFMTSYQFFCKRCNPNGLESFTKKQSNFSQMCLTALANLQHERPEQKMFSKDKDIIPFIEKNWEALTIMARRSRMKWHATISKTMCKESETFIHSDESSGDPLFALKTTDLSKIGPNYETLFRLSGAMFKGDPRAGIERSRGTKRKAPNEPSSAGRPQKRGEVTSTTKLAPSTYPTEHPFNKDGYRYVLAEPDPHAANRQAFDDSVEWAGKPIPGYLYRPWHGTEVYLAMHDRAPQLKLNDDRLTITGEKGYSMIRGTHGVNQGSWYFEVKITDMPAEAASRIGWAQAFGNLQAPCGYDKFSYSWRSKKGSRFHESRGYHYSDKGYSTGDVLGFYISLPEQKDSHKLLPPVIKDKPLVKFKSHLYFEVKDYVEQDIERAKGSKLIMYKNGKNQGVAWTDIYSGTYYPTVSLYKNATVTCNFGPKFKYPPKDIEYKPMSDRVSDIMVEQALGDMLYHIDNEGQLPEF